jgi:hypothetical protein
MIQNIESKEEKKQKNEHQRNLSFLIKKQETISPGISVKKYVR